MAYCPQCGIEYDDEVEECLDCSGPLVEGSAEEMFEDVDDSEWVELDPIASLSYAKIVKEALDDEEIPCYIQSLWSGEGFEAGYYGAQATILVPEPFYEKALEMQQGIAPPDDDQLLLDPDNPDE
ncbi:hypothetical protein K8I28_12860 [bacterium]|nr:hypothetical protein [bacterium]